MKFTIAHMRDRHSGESEFHDVYAKDEADALRICREIIQESFDEKWSKRKGFAICSVSRVDEIQTSGGRGETVAHTIIDEDHEIYEACHVVGLA